MRRDDNFFPAEASLYWDFLESSTSYSSYSHCGTIKNTQESELVKKSCEKCEGSARFLHVRKHKGFVSGCSSKQNVKMQSERWNNLPYTI